MKKLFCTLLALGVILPTTVRANEPGYTIEVAHGVKLQPVVAIDYALTFAHHEAESGGSVAGGAAFLLELPREFELALEAMLGIATRPGVNLGIGAALVRRLNRRVALGAFVEPALGFGQEYVYEQTLGAIIKVPTSSVTYALRLGWRLEVAEKTANGFAVGVEFEFK